MALKRLEEQIDTPLFEGGRKVRLTKAGQFTFEQARAVLDYYERAWGAISAFAQNEVGRVDVASVPSVAATLLPEAIRRLRTRSPNLDIEVRDMDSQSVVEAVKKDVAEIGFGTVDREIPGLAISPLLYDSLDLVCNAKDPLTRLKRPIRWKDIKGRVLLANGVCESIRTEEFKEILQSTRLHVHNVTSLIALVSADVGVTILPRLSRPPNDKFVRFLSISDPAARREVSVIVKSAQRLSPAGEAFVKTVRAVIRDLAQTLGIRSEAA
jgi:DNA-binding transcriptional LysR family regulator